MPFHSSGNNVVYSSPTWTEKFVDTDIKVIPDANTYVKGSEDGTIKPFILTVGKYERCLATINLIYQSDQTNDFGFRFITDDSASHGTGVSSVATNMDYGVHVISDVSNSTHFERIQAAMQRSTTGVGPEITIGTGSDDYPYYADIQFRVLNNTSSTAFLKFQARNLADATGEAEILVGSYIRYRKF